MTKKFGIDISTWQKGYPYAKATKEGVKFAILRAGFGTTKDNQFETHYKKAKAQNWGVGAYWYTYATTVAEAKQEVKAFLKVIKGKQFEYPIYLDIEDASIKKAGKTVLNSIVKTYGEEITKAGYYFGVYSNADWYRNKISGKELNKLYDWWVASWTKTKPSGISADMWQFGGSTNEIRSNKVAGVVTDQDYAYKDNPSIIKEKGLNGYSKATTPIKPTTTPTTTKSSEKWTTGDYKCLYAMNIRSGAGTTYRLKKVREMSVDGRKYAVSTKLSANATYKKGTVFTATKISKAKDGSIWAKSPSGYICIKGSKTTYCKKA